MKRTVLGLMLGVSTLAACDQSMSGMGEGTDDLATVSIALTTVPAGVQCVQVVTTIPGQPTTTTRQSVTAGASSATLSLGRLPAGMATFNGSAANVTCPAFGGATPTWIADPAQATLRPGVLTTVELTFRPNNPVTVSANFLENVAEIVTGTLASYARMADGTVKQWGLHGNNDSVIPVQVAITGVTALAAGHALACAITTGGVVSCWGNSNPEGFGGRILTEIPQVVVSGGAIQLTAGRAHACATLGIVSVCWGENDSGQLGDGTFTDAINPVTVLDSTAIGLFGPLFAGDDSTFCRTGNSQFYGWGDGGDAKLGNGEFSNEPSPVFLSSANGMVKISTTLQHSCGFRANGQLFCTGNNFFGQLGTGDREPRDVFTAVPGLTDIVDVAVGTSHTCALRRGGTVVCFGTNSSGQLGDGSATMSLEPRTVPDLNGVVAIQSGSSHVCAQLGDLRVKCWGANAFGQLGDNTRVGSTVPIFVKLR